MPKSPDAELAKSPAKSSRPKSVPAARNAAKAEVKTGAKPVKSAAKANANADGKAVAPTTSLKLRDLIDGVATATGTKKPDAKQAVEATLSALAAALKSGADMTLPPLGKLRVVKLAEKGGATIMTLKLRHGGGQRPGAKPLADDGEDG